MKMENVIEPECFVPMIGYEGTYLISQYGNIKSVKRGELLKKTPDGKKYHRIGLCKNGVSTTYKVHRLVAQHFVSNPSNKPQVNHKDLDKQNNFYLNLEWTTNKENSEHAFLNGIAPLMLKRGADNGFAMLTDDKVREIRAKFKPRIYTRAMLAFEYGVTENCIKDVCIRKSWKHVQ